MEPLLYRPAQELPAELRALVDPDQPPPPEIYLEYDEADNTALRWVAGTVGACFGLLAVKVIAQALFDAQPQKPEAALFVVGPLLSALALAIFWWVRGQHQVGEAKRSGRHRRGMFFTPAALVDVTEEGLVCVYPRARVVGGRVLEKKSTSTNSFYKDLGLEVLGEDGTELRDLGRGFAGGANGLVEMVAAWKAGQLAWRGHSLDRRRIDE